MSNTEIKRELQVLKRIFSLAMKDGELPSKPHIAMLREDNVRTRVLRAARVSGGPAASPRRDQSGDHLASEVLPLEWRQVDLQAGKVRLDAGTTKNREARGFPLKAELRTVLEARWALHEQQRKAGHLCPFVFPRLVAKGRGGPLHPRRITLSPRHGKPRAGLRAVRDASRTTYGARLFAMVRARIPERVAMQMTGHKTRGVFERHNIVSDGDLRAAARRLDSLSLDDRLTAKKA